MITSYVNDLLTSTFQERFIEFRLENAISEHYIVVSIRNSAHLTFQRMTRFELHNGTFTICGELRDSRFMRPIVLNVSYSTGLEGFNVGSIDITGNTLIVILLVSL
jgi:hypothetical protein